MINIRRIDMDGNVPQTIHVGRMSERKITNRIKSRYLNHTYYIISDGKWWLHLSDNNLYDLVNYKEFLNSVDSRLSSFKDEINTYIRLNKLNEVTQ